MPDETALYAAFDRFPSTKGAGTHIEQSARALGEAFGPPALAALGPKEMALPSGIETAPYRLLPYQVEESNYLRRALAYARWLRARIDEHPAWRVAQFRDVWSGIAVLDCPHLFPVFELNGLPSIELPYRYPQLAASTLGRIEGLERYCLERAGLILTPSTTLRDCLLKRGVARRRIEVIPNGAEAIAPTPEALPPLPRRYLLYFGALQPWQGVDVLLKAMPSLADWREVELVICASHKARYAKALHKLAEKWEIGARVHWRYQLDKPALAAAIQGAEASVAPLTACARNVEQGCSPLKILESMALGTAVVASDLPPVRELLVHGATGLLARPDRPAELARCLRLLLEEPAHAQHLARNAYRHWAQHHQWAELRRRQAEAVRAAYHQWAESASARRPYS